MVFAKGYDWFKGLYGLKDYMPPRIYLKEIHNKDLESIDNTNNNSNNRR
jgi:hypothetical protein